MRSAIPHTARRSTRGRLTAAAAACALLSAGTFLPAGAASASAAQPRQAGTTLQAALRQDLSDYLTARRTAEHISAVSLRITFPGTRPAISVADGSTRYDGGPPVSASAPWQIGSTTQAPASAGHPCRRALHLPPARRRPAARRVPLHRWRPAVTGRPGHATARPDLG